MERTKFSISPLFQERLKEAFLQACRAEEKAEQNCRYRLDFTTPQGWVRVKQFTNGTLYLEATDSTAHQKLLGVIQAITGQTAENGGVKPATSLKASTAPKQESTTPRGLIALEVPYIGTDESGKGDYFGPLVIAGVYTTPETSQKLKTMGVMDSKLLKDAQMKILSVKIQEILGAAAFTIIEISPKRYNDLYDNFKKNGKNLNHMLAWGHAKALETLLEKNTDCTHAIADQFGSEHYIRSQLQTRGRQITLHQTPKAEANIGVAAASILARVRFVQKLERLGAQFNTSLPPGAGTQVLQKARALVKEHGTGVLLEIAKLHFKTTQQVCI